MNPVFFLVFFTAFQIALGIATAGLALLLCTLPPLRAYRGRLAVSALGLAGGGLIGALVGYFVVILAGLAWLAMRFVRVVPPGAEVSVLVVWAFPAGYVLGTVAGAYMGWHGWLLISRVTRSARPEQLP